MKKDLLAEIKNHINVLGPHQIERRGAQLLRDAALEIECLRTSHTRLHRRAQEAEAALPEWKVICRATDGQATGRFWPALVRLALKNSEAENDELKLKVAKQCGEMRALNDRYFKAFELAGGKPDDNADDLPRLIEMLQHRAKGSLPMFDEMLHITPEQWAFARQICSPIGTIPGTAGLGPGLSAPTSARTPVLPLHYELALGLGKAFIVDAAGEVVSAVGVFPMRGRDQEEDIRALANRRIKQITRSIEERRS